MYTRNRSIILCTILLSVFCLLAPKAHGAVDEIKAGLVTTGGGRLNVRSAPSTSSGVVAALQSGSYVTLVSKSGSWWKVEYQRGKYGYCHNDYIRQVSGDALTVATQSSSLNVRSGPGTSYGKVTSLTKGEKVLVLSAGSGWSRILFHGTRTGYVSSQYLSGYYSAVSLYVPNLKQADNRWATALIGQSGKTMAQIGCATTAVAMVESHRQGKTIYPDVMASQLRYTLDGSIYWPEHYTTVTDGSGGLRALYSLLKAGKPVLYGSRNGAGKQHWVVITGFVGGANLTAAGFQIQDPGSSSRVNLQQFLAEYPNFYKYFYY